MTSRLGHATTRREDARLLAGRGAFLDDVPHADALHCAFLRSPFGCATIESLDASALDGGDGIIGVFHGGDVELEVGTATTLPGQFTPRQPVFARGRVHYAGEVVACVLATSRSAARDALELIDVIYEPFPAVLDPELALESDSPLVHADATTNACFRYPIGNGDVSDELGASDVIVRARFRVNRVTASPLEGRGVLARWDASNGVMTAWSSTQIPFAQRELFSEAAGIAEHRMRVIVPDVGGAFGQKLNTYREELICVHLARRLECAVVWVEDRSENFEGGVHARDQLQEIELGARSDGTITALRFRILADIGAFLQTQTTAVPPLTGLMSSGAYAIPRISGEVIGVFTNKAPTDAYRGAGKPEAAFLIERSVDLLAQELGLDPVEIRRKNLIAEQAFPYRTATGLDYDSGRYAHVLDRAIELADYDDLRRQQTAERANGRLLGIGVSTFVELASFGPSDVCARLFGMQAPGYESGSVRFLPSGAVVVHSGSMPSGQGHETAWAQLVASALGVAEEDIAVVVGDTSAIAHGVGTYGSRSAVIGGSALQLAAEQVIAKAKTLAAHWLEASVDDLEFADGRFSVRGSPRIGMAIQEIARAAYLGQNLPPGVEPGLEALAFFDPPNFTFPFGAHIAVVEVDPETGVVILLRYVAVGDYGNVINPMLVAGQLHGGIVQGAGQALCEEVRYGDVGQLETATYLEYPLLTCDMLPSFETALVHTPSPVNPLGLKGCGESGATGAPPAIVNAVVDAVAHLGVRHIDMPVVPQSVWRAIHAANGAG